MTYTDAVNRVEELLYDLIGQGGGDGETITEYAGKIVDALNEEHG